MSKIEIDLPLALSRFIQRQVAAGLYDTPAAAVEDAVRRLAETDDAKVGAIRAALAPGVAEADAGVFYDGDMDGIITEARAKPAKRK